MTAKSSSWMSAVGPIDQRW